MDGGLDIPHSDKRFAGFSKESKQLDADMHRKYIFGGHVAAYMTVRSNSAGILLCIMHIISYVVENYADFNGR